MPGHHERPEPASLLPQRKVASGALGGAAATIILWAIELTQATIPAVVAAAIATVVATAVAYLVPGEASS